MVALYNSFQAGAVDELAALGIRINAVSPGMTNTAGVHAHLKQNNCATFSR